MKNDFMISLRCLIGIREVLIAGFVLTIHCSEVSRSGIATQIFPGDCCSPGIVEALD